MRVSLKSLSLAKPGLILSLIFRGEERSGQEVMFCACFQLEVCMIFMTDTHARFGLSEPRSAVGKYIYIFLFWRLEDRHRFYEFKAGREHFS